MAETELPPHISPEMAQARADAKWQLSLRRWMTRMVTVALAVFLIVSAAQVYFLYQRMNEPPKLTMPLPSTGEELARAQWQALLTLEVHAVEQRYHLARISMMTRVGTVYLGFLTGMILALVGSAFVLGKLREGTTEINAQFGPEAAKGPGGSIKSASPGLILVVCGCVLMMGTLYTHQSVDVREGLVYLGSLRQPGDLPPPKSIVNDVNDLMKESDGPAAPAPAKGERK